MTGLRIVNVQRQLRERGRIRIGYSETRVGRSGKEVKVPKKLDRFLFSAPDQQTVEQAAQLYGGTAEPWEGGRDRWRVISNTDSVAVVFPAAMAFSQSYEQWSGGFCTRRCDGVTSHAPDAGRRMLEEDCLCDPDGRQCQMTTNLSVILPDLPGLGTWRLVTHGYYAGTELGAAVELIESAMSVGARVPARLFLERRERRVMDQGKPMTRKFVVPVLDLDMSVSALGPGAAMGGVLQAPPQAALSAPTAPADAPALPSGQPPTQADQGPGWSPVDQQALPAGPPPNVRDMLEDNNRPVKRRANAAPAIPATGKAPRKASATTSDEGMCCRCRDALGSEAVVRNPEPGGSKYIHRRCRDEVEAADDEAPPEDPPAVSQEQGVGGRAGTSGGDVATPAEPSPAAAAAEPKTRRPAKAMTHNQMKKLFALVPEVMPYEDVPAGPEREDVRRQAVLDICAQLGQPELTSRSEITYDTGRLLLDALEAAKNGDLVWNGERLFIASTGEALTAQTIPSDR